MPSKKPKVEELPLPKGVLKLLQPLHLIENESLDLYKQLLSAVIDSVRPRDVFELIYTMDVVNHTWDIRRLQHVASMLIRTSTRKADYDGEPRHPGFDHLEEIARRFSAPLDGSVRGPTKAPPPKPAPKPPRKTAAQIANEKALNNQITAEKLRGALPDYERIVRLIHAAEGRRRIMLREISWHRQGFAPMLEAAVGVVIDG